MRPSITAASALALLTVTCGPPAPDVARPAPAAGRITVEVDARIELFTVLARLAELEAYTEPATSSYATEVDRAFAAYRDDPAVVATRELGRRFGLSHNGPVSLAVHLDDRLQPLRPLHPAPPELDPVWRDAPIADYLAQVREFSARTRFAEFFAAHRRYHDAVEARYAPMLAEAKVVDWFDEFFGPRSQARYVMCPAPLIGSWNYGATVEALDGHQVVYQVISLGPVDEHDLPVPGRGVRDMIVHELAHSYVNPVLDRHLAELAPALAHLHAADAELFTRQGYGEPQILGYESVVRATTLLYVRDRDGAAMARRMVRDQENRGFWWITELTDLLERQRASTGGLEGRVAAIAALFREVDERQARDGRPRHAFRGPILGIFFTRDPALIVVPDPLDEASTRLGESVAELRSRHFGSWLSDVSLLPASKATPAERAGKTLIVYGSPGQNPLLVSLATAWGLEAEADHVTVAGKRFDGAGLVVVAARPQPDAPMLGALVLAAARNEDLLDATELSLSGSDWLVAHRVGGKLVVLASGDFETGDGARRWGAPPPWPRR